MMPPGVQTLRVSDEHDGERLDRFLVAALPGASRGVVRRLLEAKGVRVEGRVRKKGAQVRRGELVEIRGYVEPESWSPRPDPSLTMDVLHQDIDMIAVDKPAGVPCHPLHPDELGTAASAMVAAYPELTRVGDPRREAGLVHRLDTTTSGVLIFARRRRAYRDLVDQMRGDGGATKSYEALVEGDAMGLSEIALPLTPRGRRVVAQRPGVGKTAAGARAARTAIRPVRKLAAFTLLEVEIGAGQRHQIRAHLSAVGHPIAGDELYGATAQVPLARPFLHARRVRLRSPSTGARLTIEAPLASELSELLRGLEEDRGEGGRE